MTNDNTKAKFAAILAAAQAKAAQQATPNFKSQQAAPQQPTTPPAAIPPPTPAPLPQPVKLARLTSFKIIWHEGSGKYDGKVFTSWFDANRAMTKIFEEHSGLGYLKTKICVLWDNGYSEELRVDCASSNGNFSPLRYTIAEYIAGKNECKYIYAEQAKQHEFLSFEDAPGTPEEKPEPEPEPQPEPDNYPELSNVTFADLFNSNEPEPQQQQQQQSGTITAQDVQEITADIISEAKRENEIELIEYSPKSFALFGPGTIAIKDKLLCNGGAYNPRLKYGPGTAKGWIFSNRHKSAILSILNNL